MTVHDASFHELSGTQVYAILRLRSEVFVVEQACVYLDPDGRDIESGTRHIWTERGGTIEACLRVLDDGDVRRFGRVATRGSARGTGLAATLIEHALATTVGPWVLDAQAHLAGWYERFGFAVTGAEFDEDGIAHVPMRRAN
ncbi:MAG TPA: GNAT family N-acetyltransferase [Ilumatobacter sp.]|nr:GNAT family N-acetyltransferase [Ilumatobacter sp.]